VIQVEDWAEIRRLHRAEQMPIRAIARHLGISKNTVKRALATDRPPVYSRPLKGSAVDAVEPQIRRSRRSAGWVSRRGVQRVSGTRGPRG